MTTPPKQMSPFRPSNAHVDDFNIQDELQKEPQRRYKVDFLQKLLDDKLTYLIQTILEKQKENFEIEDDVLQRLNLLKSLNTEIEQVYKQ